MSAEFHFQTIFASWRLYAEGALGTLALVACAVPLGFALAVALALARKIAPQPIPRLVTVYVEFLRNTPFIVQLFYIYFGLGSLGFPIPAEVGALLALTLNLSAYSTEIIRAGIDSIHPSQLEAGLSLAMTRAQLYRHVVIMPALARIWPALSSQFVLTMLATSVCSFIPVTDLMAATKFIEANTSRGFEAYLIPAPIYLAIALLMKWALALLGRALFPALQDAKAGAASKGLG
ncbi:MAG TPA: amino acid ABC transporter permease [Ramlibacter sp.]|nr:amino acid ABC transporter permease [Ramlibacter sp.]